MVRRHPSATESGWHQIAGRLGGGGGCRLGGCRLGRSSGDRRPRSPSLERRTLGKWRCALSAYKGTDQTSNKQLLMDAIALPIFTYGPVDRVGVIRKLRLLPHHLWTAESPQQRQMLSFEGLYRWPEVQHARGEARTLYDPSTEQLLHRYKPPFKVHAVNPPPKKELFKWRKGREEALQLDGDRRPGAHRRRHHRAAAPALVDAPPLQSRREQARATMWSRVAARGANLRRKESGAQTAGFECAVR